MDTCRRGGDSLAGPYFRLRLHPLSVREWAGRGPGPSASLTRPPGRTSGTAGDLDAKGKIWGLRLTLASVLVLVLVLDAAVIVKTVLHR